MNIKTAGRKRLRQSPPKSIARKPQRARKRQVANEL